MVDNLFKEFLVEVGNEIRRKRTQLGIRQVDLAYNCGIDYRHFQDIEGGKKNVTLKTLYRIANGLELNVYELFGNAAE